MPQRLEASDTLQQGPARSDMAAGVAVLSRPRGKGPAEPKSESGSHEGARRSRIVRCDVPGAANELVEVFGKHALRCGAGRHAEHYLAHLVL